MLRRGKKPSFKFRLGKLLVQAVLGRQKTYVTYMALYKAYLEAKLINNRIRADFLEEIMHYFDTDD